MSNSRTIPTQDVAFNVWQETVSTAVEEYANKWGLTHSGSMQVSDLHVRRGTSHGKSMKIP